MKRVFYVVKNMDENTFFTGKLLSYDLWEHDPYCYGVKPSDLYSADFSKAKLFRTSKGAEKAAANLEKRVESTLQYLKESIEANEAHLKILSKQHRIDDEDYKETEDLIKNADSIFGDILKMRNIKLKPCKIEANCKIV